MKLLMTLLMALVLVAPAGAAGEEPMRDRIMKPVFYASLGALGLTFAAALNNGNHNSDDGYSRCKSPSQPSPLCLQATSTLYDFGLIHRWHGAGQESFELRFDNFDPIHDPQPFDSNVQLKAVFRW